MSNRVKIWSARFVLGVGLSAAASLSAAEKVQLRGSTAVELPKPNRTIDESSRFKFDNSSTMDSATGFLPPPSGGSNGALDRKLREVMDRKKNWIFENPYDRKMDSRSAEILEKEGSSNPLLDHHLLKDENKTAMQRFLEEKDAKRNRNDGPGGNNPSASSPEARAEQNDFSNPNSNNAADGKREEKPAALVFGGENSFFKDRESSFDSAAFQKKMERSPIEGGIFGQNRFADAPKVDRDALPRQEDSRPNDFGGGLSPRGVVAVASPTADSRLEAAFNPTLGPATRPDLGARRMDVPGGGTRIDFGGGGRAGAVPSSLPSSSEMGGIDSSFSRAAAFSPSPAPTSFAPPPQQQPRPFVFELPRRKF